MKTRLLQILTAAVSLVIVASCTLDDLSNRPDSISADIQQAIEEKAAQNETVRWNGTQHKSIAEFACRMLGITNSTFWEKSTEPDSWTGSNDEGPTVKITTVVPAPGPFPIPIPVSFTLNYPGKPGHCYFWRLDGSTWKHRTPYSDIFGTIRWADYNFNAMINEAYQRFRDNTNTHDVRLSHALHYMADMGVPYHNYWSDGSNLLVDLVSGTAAQATQHTDYENVFKTNWTEGKKFYNQIGARYYNTSFGNYTNPEDLPRHASKSMAESSGRQVVEAIGTGSINLNNSNVYNGTVSALNNSVTFCAGTLVWFADLMDVLRSKNRGMSKLTTQGKEMYVDVYAASGDKIYCGANWKAANGGDIDIKIYQIDGSSLVYKKGGTSTDKSLESVSWVADKSATYRIKAYAYTATSGDVALNTVVIKKKNSRYIFD
ncbi:MAG: hypothetical protein JXJ04_12185 [Spirochaetales bacterium]|nr:hypothetical protein [Spirochaetales bacterium]